MLRRELRVHLNDGGESVDADALDVAVFAGEEPGGEVGGRCEELLLRVDARDGAHSLEDDGKANRGLHVRSRHHLTQHFVHFLRRSLVGVPQNREQLEQLNLEPRRRRTVVVILSRQPMLDHLLEDRNQAGNQIRIGHRIRLRHIHQPTQTRGHDRRIAIADGPFEDRSDVLDRVRSLVDEALKGHHSALSHMGVLIGQLVTHRLQHRRHRLAAYDARDRGERSANVP
mmetsp:Transcript_20608/g.48943  ORF Transcript_20608/g.48943 Transcript_20608/m.48943 type:complete len:228 (-) Transcript_20608:651-1334(-)